MTKRIIPCLDIKDGKVVKGVQFEGLRDVGDPVELATRYVRDGADELVFLDVTASIEDRGLLYDLVGMLSEVLNIPFLVGGGIRTVEDAKQLLRNGADKVALSTAAIENPELISELAAVFGAQCVVLSVDTKSVDGEWFVTTHGGRNLMDLKCLDWVEKVVALGAGEIVLNVIDADGGLTGFACEITDQVAGAVSVPVIASGGAGNASHFVELFRKTDAAAGLAASIFHENQTTPNAVKQQLAKEGIEVRL